MGPVAPLGPATPCGPEAPVDPVAPSKPLLPLSPGSPRNTGNTAQELFDGRQCDATGGTCQPLPAKRLYPGASWEQTLPFDTPVSYRASIGPAVRTREF